MNRLSRVVLISTLILSGYSSVSFASYFFFLKSGTQPSGTQIGSQVNLSDSGAGTLTVPADALGTGSPALTFIIQGAPLQSSRVYMWKPGTKDQPECLDMGMNATGLSVPTLLDTTSQYTLTLSVATPINNSDCVDHNNPPPTRTASITGPASAGPTVNWAGYYHLYNPLSQNPNSVPEPGILALLGLGLSALVFVKRRKAAQH